MPARERTRSNGRARDNGVVPILEARPGGAAQRFAAAMEGKHPAAVFFAAVLAGYLVLALLAVLLGIVCAIERKWRIALVRRARAPDRVSDLPHRLACRAA